MVRLGKTRIGFGKRVPRSEIHLDVQSPSATLGEFRPQFGPFAALLSHKPSGLFAEELETEVVIAPKRGQQVRNTGSSGKIGSIVATDTMASLPHHPLVYMVKKTRRKWK